MTRTGWSLKIVLVLAVAALVWASAASIAVSTIESRLQAGSNRPVPQKLLTAR